MPQPTYAACMQEMKFRTVSREPRGRVGDWHKTTYRRGPLTLLYTRCAGSRWRLVVRYKSRPLGTRPYSAMPGCWTLAQGTRLTDLRKILTRAWLDWGVWGDNA